MILPTLYVLKVFCITLIRLLVGNLIIYHFNDLCISCIGSVTRQISLLAIMSTILFRGVPMWLGTQYICSCFLVATTSTASQFLRIFSDVIRCALGYRHIL